MQSTMPETEGHNGVADYEVRLQNIQVTPFIRYRIQPEIRQCHHIYPCHITGRLTTQSGLTAIQRKLECSS